MSDGVSGVARGVVLSLSAYLIWGFFPLFFRQLAGVAPAEVLAHRIIWSLLTLLPVIACCAAEELRRLFRDGRSLGLLVFSTILISTNWYVFIIAVETNQVLESSLGYFMTPFISIILGRVFLAEKLRPVQAVAVLLALSGVAVKTMALGHFPVISLVLGASFGAYGLVRKFVKADSVTALTVETALLAPFAAGYALYLGFSGKAAFLAASRWTDVLLVLAGVITAVPLALYGAALKRLRLATIGIMQFMVPTMQFMLAVFAFGEEFAAGQFFTFLLIWAGIIIYCADSWRAASAQGT